MKKIICLLIAVLMMISCFAGCGSAGEASTDKLQAVKAAGKLVMATSPDFPPFESLTPDGEVFGIEVEIMKLVCEKLGVELEIKQMSFDSVLPGVQAGKYDVGVSGISVTPAREKNVLFTTPYCLAAQAIVVLEGSEVTCKADLDGKKISLQSGTTAETFCLENNYDISPFSANSDAQMALTTGKVAAWVIDDLTAKEMVDAYNADDPDTKLVILDEAMTTEPYAFAFQKGSETLVAEIDKILKDLIADGTIAALFKEYNAPYTSPAN